MWRNLFLLVVSIGVGVSLTYFYDFSGGKPSGADAPSPKSVSQKAEKVPEFTFQSLDGKNYGIGDFSGKMVILNFWASWCPPCVKEFPLFLRFAQDYPDEVVFIGLSSDHDMSAMNRFLSKMSYRHPRAMEGQNVILSVDEGGKITRERFQTYKLPETIIINEKGRMKEKLVGADWTYDDLKALVFDSDD